MPRSSAGLLLFRRDRDGLRLLLAHPGGPAWKNRDVGAWTVPKGEIEADEQPLDVAVREFREEIGHPPPDGHYVPLGDVRQKAGKVVSVWAVEGDLDPATARSNTFPIRWPPRSDRWISVPEVDRVEWFDPVEARRRLNPAQVEFVDRLVALLEDG